MIQSKKISYKKVPKLKVHSYVVTVVGYDKKAKKWKTKYQYCTSKKEVEAVKRKAQLGAVVEVYIAKHTFAGAFERVAV